MVPRISEWVDADRPVFPWWRQDLGNTSFTPKYVADMSVNMGYYVDGVGTDWTLMTAGASELGINSAQLTNWSEDTLKSELSAGHPIICSMGPGDFTNQGHFIVLSGLT